MVEGPPGCPSGPSITCSSSTLAGDFGPLHRGPISRPYPTREPLLIGAPRAGSAEPTDGQAIAASDTTIRSCIQCQQETINLCPRYSTFAQHPPRLMQNAGVGSSREQHRIAIPQCSGPFATVLSFGSERMALIPRPESHVRHETAGTHKGARRRVGRMAACRTRAAAGDACWSVP